MASAWSMSAAWPRLGFLAIAVVIAPQIERAGSVWQYLMSMLSYTSPPIVAVFLWGLFWPRANARGASWAIIVGLVSAVLFIVPLVISKVDALAAFRTPLVMGIADVHFLYIAPILLVASSVALVAGSLGAPAIDPARIAGLLWNRAFFDAETVALRGTPWITNYRVLSVVLLGLTAIIVIAFR